MYRDKLTACQGILGESVEIAQSTGLPFAVVGGWSPFYLNNPAGLHPGSKDVDLLFSEAVEVKGLAKVVERFLARGYLPSAKHDFQLLRVVDGGNGRFVFNVDFLHPKESTVPPGESLFVDHLELPFPESEFIKEQHFVRSIALPSSQFIFDFKRIAQKSVRCRFVDGREAEVTVPLADEAAILVTKSESMRGSKRPRDPLDVYLAIAYCRDRSETTSFFGKILKTARPEIYNTLFQIAMNVLGDEEFAHRVPLPVQNKTAIREPIETILDFLKEAGIDIDNAAREAQRNRPAERARSSEQRNAAVSAAARDSNVLDAKRSGPVQQMDEID